MRFFYLCVWYLLFFFFMFSFLSFFGKMYLKYSSFNFLFPFYQLRVNDKIEIERKNWLFISAFQQMRISIGERKKGKFFKNFFTKANNKKIISNDFFTKRLSFIALKSGEFRKLILYIWNSFPSKISVALANLLRLFSSFSFLFLIYSGHGRR